MTRIIFFLSILIIVLACSCESFSADEKIYINSNTLEVDYAEGIAEYQTNIFVQKKGNFDLYCDRAKIFSITKKSSGKNINISIGNIEHIELYDNITIVKGAKIAKGDFGIIYPQKKLIILTGKVKLKEKTESNENYLEGSEVEYYIDQEVFKIKNNTVPNNQKKRRVKVILSELNKSK